MIVCRQCGQRNADGAEFCEACGTFLEWEGERVDAGPSKPSPSAAEPPPPPAQAPPAPGPPPAPAFTSVPPPPPPQQAAPPATPSPQEPPEPPAGKAGGDDRKSAAGKVRCLECGAYNAADRRFCVRCGASIDLVLLGGSSPATAQPPGPATPATAQPPGPATPPTPVPSAGRPPSPPPAPSPDAKGRPPGPAPSPTPAPSPPPLPAAGQAPAGERAQGMQPAMAKERPPPSRPAPSEPSVAPGGPICPQCDTANEPGRRFCRRCGASLAGAALAGGPPVTAPALSWWQRLLARFRRKPPEGTDPDRYRSAKAAFRSSLSLRYRVLRVFGVLAFLGLGVGMLGVSRINPVSGARDLWREVFPRYDRITEVQASSVPAELDRREFEANDSVDGAPNTAWGSGWQLAADDRAARGCADEPNTGGAETALLLTLSETSDLAKLEIQPGLPRGDAARENQWQPTRIELRYTHDEEGGEGGGDGGGGSGGEGADEAECQVIDLDGDPGMQSHEIEVSDVSSVRLTVLDANAPTSGSGELVTIGEVRLFSPG